MLSIRTPPKDLPSAVYVPLNPPPHPAKPSVSSATNETTIRYCDLRSASIARLLLSKEGSFLRAHHRVAHQHGLERWTLPRKYRARPTRSADHDLVAVHSVLACDFRHSQDLDVD